jgi:release factor glutamine methyltransferase
MKPSIQRIRDLLKQAAAALPESSTPRLDAELLLAHVLGKDRLWLITHADNEVPDGDLAAFNTLIERRRDHLPIAYILGHQEFFGLSFQVDESVLIPRPESEAIVEYALKVLADLTHVPRVLDLGTGSGCLAITIAALFKGQIQVTATDRSVAALATARCNAEIHNVQDKIAFFEQDWMNELPKGPFDLVVANPPYVARHDLCSPETRHEPQAALYAEDDGFADIAHLLKQIPPLLEEEGSFVCELGLSHPDRIRSQDNTHSMHISFLRDLSDRERFLLYRKATSSSA